MTHQEAVKDGELWDDIALGNRHAFAAVFDRHAEAVFAHLLRKVGDYHEAEDLTSAVFLTAWRRRVEVSLDRDSALPWLLGVANHTLANRRRAMKRYRRLVAKVRPPADVPDPADDIAERIDAEERAQALRRSIRRLPKHERDVVELCVWGGLDHPAAAVALGVAVGTVHARISRAKKRLGTLVPEELEAGA
jgi:RNA polymerase sigma-70 factor, ECF subfamily